MSTFLSNTNVCFLPQNKKVLFGRRNNLDPKITKEIDDKSAKLVHHENLKATNMTNAASAKL